MASSASGGGLKEAQAVGSPLPSVSTGRGPEASTEEKTRPSTARMLMLPASASGAPRADGREICHPVVPSPSISWTSYWTCSPSFNTDFHM
jgi:hypothetical protein